MTTATLYYNPRCSKCRAALSLLRERGIEPRVVDYQEQPLTVVELKALLGLLGFGDARAVMRRGESEYAALDLDNPAQTQESLIAALAGHARLLERPVFVHRDRAIIGRPPERVLEIL